METYNKEKIKEILNSELTIHWWNFGTKTLSFKGSVKDYLIKEKVKYSIKTEKNEWCEGLKITINYNCGNLNNLRFTTNNLEDAVRMVINIKLSYMGDKSTFIFLDRARTINH